MSRALSTKQAIALSDCWHALGHGLVFVVAAGREFLVEPPEERQDREEDDEAVLRVFTDREDAWLYCEQQEDFKTYDDEPTAMRVLGLSMEDLFKLKSPIIRNGTIDFGVSVRADVCALTAGEPVVIDTLWSSTINPN